MPPTYAEKLKASRWQKKRLELLEAAQWKCQNEYCDNTNSNPTLHVHHRLYLKGKQPWDYEDWAYQVLCEDCHKHEQESMKAAYEALAKHPSLLYICARLVSRPDKEAKELVEAIAECGQFRDSLIGPTSKLMLAVADAVGSAFGEGLKTAHERQKTPSE